MKLTRRQLAAAISGTVSATAIARAQTQPAATPADELQAARDRQKANSDLLARQDVPTSTAPAFRFEV